MAILERFGDIIKANINELLDKCEDPAKMIDQYLRDLTESLAEVKKETAGVMAEETRAKRMLDDNAAEVEKYDSLARKALTAGNEGDAKVFLAKKQSLVEKAASLQATYDAAHENAQKMRQMHDKLVNDIEELNGRREMVKAKMAVPPAPWTPLPTWSGRPIRCWTRPTLWRSCPPNPRTRLLLWRRSMQPRTALPPWMRSWPS